MLKRDVPGLEAIASQLGAQPGIQGVMILNPDGVVRFSSVRENLDKRLPALVPNLGAEPSAEFGLSETGKEVLRSVNPVPNQPDCVPCHGSVASHPVNGILVVDYDAAEIRSHAWWSAIAFAVAGVSVLLLIMAILWRSLSRQVLAPVEELSRASAALEAGRLGERVNLPGNDEFSALGDRFNRMADRLESQIAQIRANEAYLQEIIDALPDGLRVIRVRDWKVLLANRAFCQQVAWPADALIGKPCYLCSHNRDIPCVVTLVVCPVVELTRVGDTIKTTHHHQRKDGSQFPVEINAVLVEIDHKEGKERYVVESVRDLGQAARISHEQRLSELGLLAAGIAHEIHNPLGSVRLGVQGLAREIKEKRITPEQSIDYMELIDQEIDNCIAVTRRLLLLARPPTSDLQLVVLNDAINDTLHLLDFDAQIRKIKQQAEFPEQTLRVLADEAEVRMIFLNLVQNAHHAMPQGGELRVRLTGTRTKAKIEIFDTGVGMTPEHILRIFDPFFSRRADGISGTGLGLTIVKNLVAQLHGEIDVVSQVGHGSCFRIELPLAEAVLESTE